MKKLIFTLAAGLTIAFAVSCDKIDDPLKEGGIVNPPDPETTVRKILVEDYTGNYCKNCPKAAKAIKDIEGLFGEQAIGLAVHSGSPIFSPVGRPPYDTLHTDETKAWSNFFSVAGLPTGMVNRMGFPNSHLKAYSAWSGLVNDHIDDEPQAKITLETSYNEGTRTVSVTVNTEFLSTISGSFNLQTVLTEDSIVSPQLMEDNSTNVNYVHNHVMRKTGNTTFGESCATDPVVGEQGTFTHDILLEDDYREDHCNVIAFIYNLDTQEVIQVEKISVK